MKYLGFMRCTYGVIDSGMSTLNIGWVGLMLVTAKPLGWCRLFVPGVDCSFMNI